MKRESEIVIGIIMGIIMFRLLNSTKQAQAVLGIMKVICQCDPRKLLQSLARAMRANVVGKNLGQPAIITSPEKDPGKKCCEQGDVEKYGEKDQDIPNSEKRKNDRVSLQPPAKRIRRIQSNVKRCSVKGCQNAHFGQRNGHLVQSAKRTSALLM